MDPRKPPDNPLWPVDSEWDADSATPVPSEEALTDAQTRRAGARHPRARTPGTRLTATAAFEKLDEVSDRLERRISDHADHDEDALARLDLKIDAHSQSLGTLRETTAEMRGILRSIEADVSHQRELTRISEKAEAETGVEMVKLQRDRIPWRGKIILAVIGVVGTAVGAITSWLIKRG